MAGYNLAFLAAFAHFEPKLKRSHSFLAELHGKLRSVAKFVLPGEFAGFSMRDA